jgi:hypothetical protein
MARRWFSRKGLTTESETFDILVHTNEDAKVNGSSILTESNLTGVGNELVATTQPGITAGAGASVTTLSWNALASASSFGITRPSATTIRTTKKGNYIFEVEILPASTDDSDIIVTIFKNGVLAGTQRSVYTYTVLNTPRHTFHFLQNVPSDANNDWTFQILSLDATPDPQNTTSNLRIMFSGSF